MQSVDAQNVNALMREHMSRFFRQARDVHALERLCSKYFRGGIFLRLDSFTSFLLKHVRQLVSKFPLLHLSSYFSHSLYSTAVSANEEVFLRSRPMRSLDLPAAGCQSSPAGILCQVQKLPATDNEPKQARAENRPNRPKS